MTIMAVRPASSVVVTNGKGPIRQRRLREVNLEHGNVHINQSTVQCIEAGMSWIPCSFHFYNFYFTQGKHPFHSTTKGSQIKATKF